MTGDGIGYAISRLMRSASGFNTLNVPTAEVFFQRSPGNPQGPERGINSLEFRVIKNGVVIQSGRTGDDGKIDMSLPGGNATLELLVNGAMVAQYDVRLRAGAAEAVNTTAGQQRRLRMLGYHLGHAGAPESVGVDGTMNRETDRSVLEFQADSNVAMTGDADANVQNALTNAAGV
jgi:hypothetical protein